MTRTLLIQVLLLVCCLTGCQKENSPENRWITLSLVLPKRFARGSRAFDTLLKASVKLDLVWSDEAGTRSWTYPVQEWNALPLALFNEGDRPRRGRLIARLWTRGANGGSRVALENEVAVSEDEIERRHVVMPLKEAPGRLFESDRVP